MEKTKLKSSYDKGELIKYKDTYYEISNILLDSKKISIYELSSINKNKKDSKTITVESTDKNITGIYKKDQEKILSYLKFVDRYNSTISFLNKKKNNTYTYLDSKNIHENMDHFFTRCKLKMPQLNKIEHTLKKTHQNSLQIENIYKNPFNFITQEYQLITYDKAEKICYEYLLKINFNIKLEKWSYDLFLSEKKTFYIPKWLYIKEMEKFCNDRKENSRNFLEYIDKTVIDKKIGKDKFGNDMIYKTTEYLLNFEKKMTDLIMDLYYDKEYDIEEEEILKIIKMYEEKKSKEKKIDFILENEQKKSVVNSIQNKLSIITGPPGTGKTEILKCINFVFSELYKKDSNHSVDNLYNEYNEYNEYNYCHDTESEDETIDEETIQNSNPKTIGLLAPTGLAFVNMQRSQESNHYNDNTSGTCHKILYNIVPKIKKARNTCNSDEERKKLNISLLETDEVSMLDTFVFNDLLKVCKYFKSRLILLGDVDQLPSIGPGKILYQLIKSEVFTVTKLTKIKRQSDGGLVKNILKMSKEIITKADFIDDSMILLDIEKFITSNKEINNEEIIKLISEHKLTQNNTKFITSFNLSKFIFNTKIINSILQDIYNPLNKDDKYYIIPSNYNYENSVIFRKYDNIIRTENDYSSDKMRANGEEAKIEFFDGKKVTIKYSGLLDEPEEIGINELYENFMLNYCVTVHKSQGSQYENIIFIIEPNNTIIEKKTIYTAISRAKEKCIIISKESDFLKLQGENKKIDYKNSLFMEESDNCEFSN